jgi:hypothetical protein
MALYTGSCLWANPSLHSLKSYVRCFMHANNANDHSLLGTQPLNCLWLFNNNDASVMPSLSLSIAHLLAVSTCAVQVLAAFILASHLGLPVQRMEDGRSIGLPPMMGVSPICLCSSSFGLVSLCLSPPLVVSEIRVAHAPLSLIVVKGAGHLSV